MTPSKLKTQPWEDTVKISKDYATTAIDTLAKLPRKQASPLRFVYMSGHFALRERTEQSKILQDRGMLEYGYVRVSTYLPTYLLTTLAASIMDTRQLQNAAIPFSRWGAT